MNLFYLYKNIHILIFIFNNMQFKQFNSKRKEKDRTSSYPFTQIKHLTLLTKNKKAQPALEYMMIS